MQEWEKWETQHFLNINFLPNDSSMEEMRQYALFLCSINNKFEYLEYWFKI